MNDSVRVLLIDFLLENGSDVNILNSRYALVSFPFISLMEFNFPIPCFSGESALHYAVRLGRVDVVGRLISAGADIERRGDVYGKTPRQLAQDYRHSSIYEYLTLAHGIVSFTYLTPRNTRISNQYLRY